MADDDRYERALTKLEEVFGPRPPAQPQEGIPDLLSEVGRTCVEYCYGDAWSRPGIDAKTRSFVTIGVLTALGAQDELALHIRGALRLGHTKEDVAELLLHLIPYCGVPRTVHAQRLARQVFRETPAA